MNKYKIGMICGRFQTLHNGHEILFNTGLELCEELLIFVGSAQEHGTERNPFKVETRIKMIKSIYDIENVKVFGLDDLTNENDFTVEWGKYLLENARRKIGNCPNVMIYGNDESRSRWFAAEDIKNISEVIINRNDLPISATMIRDLMIADNKEEWMKYINPKIHNMYEELRNELMRVPFYQNKYNKLKGDLIV